ncbi:hypothetical protein [Phytoactinopolyspora limicola]|uniref:hypothetical protein n=1 Tax=Phytoactinopolyspora limicola TaxID=2715536 RepID=UPI0014078F02|nr:hypothetical protein [Phytoactinopolyspora limicola]
MSVHTSTDEFLIRPCREEYKQMLKATPPVILLLALFPAIQQGVAGLVIAVVTAACCFVGLHFYFRGVHIVLTPTEIGRSGLTPRRRMWPRSDIAMLVVADIHLSIVDSRFAENLFLLDRTGRTILRLRSTHWSREDRTALIQRLGMRPVVHPDVVDPPTFATSYPKALPWYERLSFIKMVGVAILVLVGIVMIAAVVAAFTVM